MTDPAFRVHKNKDGAYTLSVESDGNVSFHLDSYRSGFSISITRYLTIDHMCQLVDVLTEAISREHQQQTLLEDAQRAVQP